ncbi:GGDEF domain-containing protein [Roseateles sp. BYS180W]|uniref:diguanylate cyclase n=1 Tax=Roseateles rivi TaxID=3299028 RepID=A0ABW7FSL8_9BURK
MVPTWPHLHLPMAGNAALLLAQMLYLQGTRQHLGMAQHDRAMLCACALTLLGLLLFTYVWPHYRARVALMSFCMALIYARHAWLLLRQGGAGLGMRFTGCCQALMCSIMMLRCVSSPWTLNDSSAQLMPTPMQVIYVGSFSLMVLLINMGQLVMVSERLRDEYRRLATQDSLTGSLTRHAWLELFHHELARLQRHPQPLCAMLIDIDWFKNVNDQYGHLVGDQVLRRVCQTLHAALRPSDGLGRYGGEEFVVLLPAVDAQGALRCAQRLCAAVAELPSNQGLPGCTVSIGVSAWRPGESCPEPMLARADAALYLAKAQGRNRACLDEALQDSANVAAAGSTVLAV